MEHWELPDLLREDRRSGRGVAATLRANRSCGTMWLTRHLLEAFDFEIDLATARAVVEALDDHGDSHVDGLIEATVASPRTGRREV
jgi:hypothetical protein